MLTKKVGIVTGASRGIGKAIAQLFARHGASLALVATENDTPHLANVCNSCNDIGADAIILPGDIAESHFSEHIVSATLARYKRIDIIINCAGVILRDPLEEHSDAAWQRVIDVNLAGPFYLCRAALPHMRKLQSGSIVNIASQMARIPHPSAAPSYECSKAGLVALTRHIALNYAQHNVRANAISPGSIDTDLPKSMSAEQRAGLKSRIPLHRLGAPEEVAQCALFLASEASSYVTGEVMTVTGGSLMD